MTNMTAAKNREMGGLLGTHGSFGRFVRKSDGLMILDAVATVVMVANGVDGDAWVSRP